MTREEFFKIAAQYGSRDKVTFNCVSCGIDHQRIKKNILKSFKSDTIDFVFCSLDCYCKFNSTKVNCNCSHCGKIIQRVKNQVKVKNFCSSSCAASLNNTLKQTRSEESRDKTSKSLKNYWDNITGEATLQPSAMLTECGNCQGLFTKLIANKKYCSLKCEKENRNDKKKQKLANESRRHPKCAVSFVPCKNCSITILRSPSQGKHSKFCSKTCRSTWQSAFQSERLKHSENRKNIGRHRKSYLESSFESWLTENNVTFKTEVHYRNTELNKSYYVDFLFEDLNLVIELDGKQHEKTKEKDAIRDEFLKRVYNLNIVRITHKEYKTKSRLDEIKCLLML